MFRVLIRLLPKKIRTKLARRLSNAFLEADPDRFVQVLLKKVEENFNVEESRKYNSAEDEIDEQLEELPELKPYRVYFVNVCRNLRVRNGLGG